MARYLLDTNTLIDFSKGHEPTRSWLLNAIEQGDELGLCAINVSEFFAGVTPADRTGWVNFFDELSFWPISISAARRAGIFRYDHARLGIGLSTTDTIVAAVAEEQGATVVTRNVNDYPMSTVELLSLQNE